MYLVSGCNLFGQWMSYDPIFVRFKKVSVYNHLIQYFKRTPRKVRLLQVNWSYNIFEVDDTFYLSGSWKGKENQFLKFKLPEECKQCLQCNNQPDLSLVGNDYHLILINKETYDIWMISLDKENEVKKLKLNVDAPLGDIDTKRPKISDKIIKTVATNNSCLYLTKSGTVYSGFLPTYLHISFSNMEEKVSDIESGYDHFMMLTDKGNVYTWGNGRKLQLGHGDLSNLESPTEVKALAGIKIVKISAGGWHSLALSEFGDLYTWGWNDTGQLGIKTQPDNPQGVLKTEGLKSYPLPTLVDLYDENDKEVNFNIKDIACGSRHSAIVLEDNSVWTSGSNKYGQLGLAPEEYSVLNYFKKCFQCNETYKLKCGLWSTILIQED